MPAGNPRILETNKPFEKGDKRINRNGRPRKLIAHINNELKLDGYEAATSEQIKHAFMTMLNLPISKITEMSKKEGDEYPMLYKLVAKEMIGKRGMEMMEKMLDRVIGKAQQFVDVSTLGEKINQIDLSTLTTAELIERSKAASKLPTNEK